MAKLGSAGFTLALTAATMMAAPAAAVKDFSSKGSMPVSNVSLYGATHTIDNASIAEKFTRVPGAGPSTVSSVPEPANWLMMVAGFGLLGAMSRRSDSDRLRDEMVL